MGIDTVFFLRVSGCGGSRGWGTVVVVVVLGTFFPGEPGFGLTEVVTLLVSVSPSGGSGTIVGQCPLFTRGTV